MAVVDRSGRDCGGTRVVAAPDDGQPRDSWWPDSWTTMTELEANEGGLQDGVRFEFDFLFLFSVHSFPLDVMQQCFKVCNYLVEHIGLYTDFRQFSYKVGGLNATQSLNYLWSHKFGRTRKMMVDSGAAAEGSDILLPEKYDAGSYASGGWKSEDETLSCGYSTFRGKKASMEDFHDIKASKFRTLFVVF